MALAGIATAMVGYRMDGNDFSDLKQDASTLAAAVSHDLEGQMNHGGGGSASGTTTGPPTLPPAHSRFPTIPGGCTPRWMISLSNSVCSAEQVGEVPAARVRLS